MYFYPTATLYFHLYKTRKICERNDDNIDFDCALSLFSKIVKRLLNQALSWHSLLKSIFTLTLLECTLITSIKLPSKKYNLISCHKFYLLSHRSTVAKSNLHFLYFQNELFYRQKHYRFNFLTVSNISCPQFHHLWLFE